MLGRYKNKMATSDWHSHYAAAVLQNCAQMQFLSRFDVPSFGLKVFGSSALGIRPTLYWYRAPLSKVGLLRAEIRSHLMVLAPTHRAQLCLASWTLKLIIFDKIIIYF
jgi:hypothetical protein